MDTRSCRSSSLRVGAATDLSEILSCASDLRCLAATLVVQLQDEVEDKGIPRVRVQLSFETSVPTLTLVVPWRPFRG
jgi:hypothetical protein